MCGADGALAQPAAEQPVAHHFGPADEPRPNMLAGRPYLSSHQLQLAPLDKVGHKRHAPSDQFCRPPSSMCGRGGSQYVDYYCSTCLVCDAATHLAALVAQVVVFVGERHLPPAAPHIAATAVQPVAGELPVGQTVRPVPPHPAFGRSTRVYLANNRIAIVALCEFVV